MIALQVTVVILLIYFLGTRYKLDQSPLKAFTAEFFLVFAIGGSLLTLVHTAVTAYSLLGIFENLWFLARLGLAFIASISCLGLFVLFCYLIYLTIIKVERAYENY